MAQLLQNANNVPVMRRAKHGQAANGDMQGQVETIRPLAPMQPPVTQGVVLDNDALAVVNNIAAQNVSTHEPSNNRARCKTPKGKQGKKVARPTVNTLSQAVLALQDNASESSVRTEALRTQVASNNHMIHDMTSKRDIMMKAIANISTQLSADLLCPVLLLRRKVMVCKKK